jgi:hypothetical protein
LAVEVEDEDEERRLESVDVKASEVEVVSSLVLEDLKEEDFWWCGKREAFDVMVAVV